jgi:hypothetical protein
VFHRFPVSVWLHLVTNLRQRIRNHTLQMTPGAPEVNAAAFEDLVRPGVVSVPGQAGAMNDAGGPCGCVRVRQLDGADPRRSVDVPGDGDGQRFDVVRSEAGAISVAFAMFSRIYVGLGDVATQAKKGSAKTAGEMEAR